MIDHWWQTETGWAIAGNPTGLESMPIKAGSATKPIPGYQVEILNELGENMPANQQGFVALKGLYHQAVCQPFGVTMTVLSRAIWRNSPVIMYPVMAVISMKKGISSSWDASMM